jgi:hypothetical protein
MRRFDRSLVFGLAAVVWLVAGFSVVSRPAMDPAMDPAVDRAITPQVLDAHATKADMRAVYL